MSKDEDKTELNTQQKFHLWLHVIDRITSIVMFGLKVVISLGFFWSIVKIAESWAGKYTKADVNLSLEGGVNVFLNVLSKLDSSIKLAWVIAFIAVLYGLYERKLRQRKTKYFQDRIVTLEKKFDVNRNSSELLPTGETRKEDLL